MNWMAINRSDPPETTRRAVPQYPAKPQSLGRCPKGNCCRLYRLGARVDTPPPHTPAREGRVFVKGSQANGQVRNTPMSIYNRLLATTILLLISANLPLVWANPDPSEHVPLQIQLVLWDGRPVSDARIEFLVLNTNQRILSEPSDPDGTVLFAPDQGANYLPTAVILSSNPQTRHPIYRSDETLRQGMSGHILLVAHVDPRTPHVRSGKRPKKVKIRWSLSVLGATIGGYFLGDEGTAARMSPYLP